MAKKPTRHSYAELPAFERLMLLIATLVQYPGVGCLDLSEPSEREQYNALQEVQTYLQQVTRSCGIDLPDYSIHTLRKDLECLKRYGILEQRRYRWGYYLGTGLMSCTEFQVALNVLESKAKYQQDPTAGRIYRTLIKRMQGTEQQARFLYPVRAQLNGCLVYTNPDELITKARYRHTLFHELEKVEQAILQGQAIQLYRTRDPYQTVGIGKRVVWPLQFIHFHHAWYLLYEQCHDGYLFIERVDRFSDECQFLNSKERSLAAQRQSLQEAHKLLEKGWGLYLGQPEEQKLERMGKLDFVTITVRFFPKVMTFILEGDCRHPSQTICKGPRTKDGKFAYLDYTVTLPPRSLGELSHWIHKFLGNARVLSPPELVEKHRQLAQNSVAL
jgi:hypothetical protein